jgi:ribonuclease E
MPPQPEVAAPAAAAMPIAPAAIAAPAAAPVVEPPRETPVVPAPARAPEARVSALPPPSPLDVDRALRDSGLVMIETAREKVQPGAPVEEAQPPRARRERRPPPPDLDVPLQQVETRKGDGEAPPPH